MRTPLAFGNCKGSFCARVLSACIARSISSAVASKALFAGFWTLSIIAAAIAAALSSSSTPSAVSRSPVRAIMQMMIHER
jgi:hypothetical protein